MGGLHTQALCGSGLEVGLVKLYKHSPSSPDIWSPPWFWLPLKFPFESLIWVFSLKMWGLSPLDSFLTFFSGFHKEPSSCSVSIQGPPEERGIEFSCKRLANRGASFKDHLPYLADSDLTQALFLHPLIKGVSFSFKAIEQSDPSISQSLFSFLALII